MSPPGASFGPTDPLGEPGGVPAQPPPHRWGISGEVTHSPPGTIPTLSFAGGETEAGWTPRAGLQRGCPHQDQFSCPPGSALGWRWPPRLRLGARLPPPRRVRLGEQRALIGADSCSALAGCVPPFPRGPRGRQAADGRRPLSRWSGRGSWGWRGTQPRRCCCPTGPDPATRHREHDHSPPTLNPGVLPTAPDAAGGGAGGRAGGAAADPPGPAAGGRRALPLHLQRPEDGRPHQSPPGGVRRGPVGPWGRSPAGCWGPPPLAGPPLSRAAGCGSFPADLRHIQPFPPFPGRCDTLGLGDTRLCLLVCPRFWELVQRPGWRMEKPPPSSRAAG
ncbi:collagen alpha-1(I) chain-like [Chroicocephalus ridibundus]|uniref:collagen alpha-1(I) chain-like n=1 Tax=Chroicocephalus ridibundus TaxID=1192867 RepID=UPI002FDED703